MVRVQRRVCRVCAQATRADNVLVELAHALERLSLATTRILIAYRQRDERERKFFDAMAGSGWTMSSAAPGVLEFRK